MSFATNSSSSSSVVSYCAMSVSVYVCLLAVVSTGSTRQQSGERAAAGVACVALPVSHGVSVCVVCVVYTGTIQRITNTNQPIKWARRKAGRGQEFSSYY
jgi:hypothetical protein